MVEAQARGEAAWHAMTRDELLALLPRQAGCVAGRAVGRRLVVKVDAKIFAFLGGPDSTSVGVKCGSNRDEADEWLIRFPDEAAAMAYIGRSGWNTLTWGGAIDDDEILEAVDASYDTIVAKLPKSRRPDPQS